MAVRKVIERARESGKVPADAHLLCFLDDATRYIPHATFTFGESTALFLPAFKTALIRCGIPERLYTEYVARHIFSVMWPVRLCAQLAPSGCPAVARAGITAHSFHRDFSQSSSS